MHPVARSRPTDTPRVRARRYARRRTWLRVLALTVALLVPTAHAATHAAASLPPTASSELPTTECDLLGNAPRPQARHTLRPSAPPRSPSSVSPVPTPATRHDSPCLPARPWPRPPCALHALRSVVLRC
ncbi:hypothetical protein [Streptomyces caniscabiei]|uniref:hypothetical protein n=1 Tax=Streptomyces caniscabiei TaxID=2746961 RepID=UPI000AA8EA70|nr:hypothetical protein [Streptomyces caniscabiei]